MQHNNWAVVIVLENNEETTPMKENLRKACVFFTQLFEQCLISFLLVTFSNSSNLQDSQNKNLTSAMFFHMMSSEAVLFLIATQYL